MNTLLLRRSARACVIGLFTVLSSGCVVTGGGYGYDGGAGIGAGYYEPVGVDYGGWGPGYQVAPVRGGYNGPGRGGGNQLACLPTRARIPRDAVHSVGFAFCWWRWRWPRWRRRWTRWRTSLTTPQVHRDSGTTTIAAAAWCHRPSRLIAE